MNPWRGRRHQNVGNALSKFILIDCTRILATAPPRRGCRHPEVDLGWVQSRRFLVRIRRLLPMTKGRVRPGQDFPCPQLLFGR